MWWWKGEREPGWCEITHKDCAVSQFTKNCRWEEIQIKAIFLNGAWEILKLCVEAGTNLLCQAVARAEVHPLTVWRRKTLFMLVHQGFQTCVSKHRSFYLSHRAHFAHRAPWLELSTSLHCYLNRKNQGNFLAQFCRDFHQIVWKPFSGSFWALWLFRGLMILPERCCSVCFEDEGHFIFYFFTLFGIVGWGLCANHEWDGIAEEGALSCFIIYHQFHYMFMTMGRCHQLTF